MVFWEAGQGKPYISREEGTEAGGYFLNCSNAMVRTPWRCCMKGKENEI